MPNFLRYKPEETLVIYLESENMIWITLRAKTTLKDKTDSWLEPALPSP